MSHLRAMLVGMDSSHDFDRPDALRRHLRAVSAAFPEADGDRPDPPDPTALDAIPGMLAGDEFARRQLDLFTHLIAQVGDADALWRLDAIPLPDEPFDWSVVEPRDVAFVEQVLALSDRCCVEMLDIEFRTVTPSHPGPRGRPRPATLPAQPARGSLRGLARVARRPGER